VRVRVAGATARARPIDDRDGKEQSAPSSRCCCAPPPRDGFPVHLIFVVLRPEVALNVSAGPGALQAAFRGIAKNIRSWRAFRRLTDGVESRR
jgi:hypothetical protein